MPPAATYAHVCHRDAENDIAAQLVPGGAGCNGALGDGVDVVLGGTQFFVPKDGGGKRTDGRNGQRAEGEGLCGRAEPRRPAGRRCDEGRQAGRPVLVEP